MESGVKKAAVLPAHQHEREQAFAHLDIRPEDAYGREQDHLAALDDRVAEMGRELLFFMDDRVAALEKALGSEHVTREKSSSTIAPVL